MILEPLINKTSMDQDLSDTVSISYKINKRVRKLNKILTPFFLLYNW